MKDKIRSLPALVQVLIGIAIIPFLIVGMPFMLIWIMGRLIFNLVFEDTEYRGAGARPVKPRPTQVLVPRATPALNGPYIPNPPSSRAPDA